MKCPRCEHENRATAKFCEACATPLNTVSPDRPNTPSYAELKSALSDALEQQMATAEVLQIISRSPTDLQPVLDTVVRSAARFCGADDAIIFQLEGAHLRLAAHYGPVPARLGLLLRVVPGTVVARAVLERRAIHTSDVQSDPEEYPETSAVARKLGYRTQLSVPLLREGTAIGAVSLRRSDVNPFTDKQITLLQTFAAQAVIAIENVRLFNETKEALEQQTATSNILRVISQSRTDEQPVFDVIVESMTRLFRAWSASVWRYEGQFLHHVAARGGMPGSEDVLRGPWRAQDVPVGRTVLEGVIVHFPDTEAPGADPISREIGRARGFRAVVFVPMMRDGEAVGALSVTRVDPGSFSEIELDVLKTFADQAVIAIENVRLFRELEARNSALSESLEQQTATSDILRVISSSPTDVQPVFDAIVRSAVRLCGGLHGVVDRFDGELIHFVAQYNYTPEALQMTQRMYPRRPDRKQAAGRAILTGDVVNIADVQADPDYATDLAVAGGWRSVLNVPMLHEGKPIGTIGVIRGHSGRFSDAQVELLKTFADQAVIAIENVRLFTELQEKNRALTQAHAQVTEALEQQTATSEILRVISSSPTDVQPVFDAITESAARLCGVADGWIVLTEGGTLRAVSAVGQLVGQLPVYNARGVPLTRESVIGRAILNRTTIHIDDLAAASEAEYPEGRALQRMLGHRTQLVTPLLREGVAIGAILLSRFEVRLFSERQIELLKTFADQAVIAIENVRLFNETKEALEQQTATSEILRTIAHVQTDAQPVFDTIVQSAARLCHAAVTGLFLTDGQMVYLPANYGSSPETLAVNRARFPRPLDMDTPPGVAMLTRSVIRVSDTEEPSAMEYVRQAGRLLGFRSGVTVPMLREGEAVGAISVTRREPGHFSDAEVGLLKTFADQAVIAVENVRLFKELDARTADLTRSVEQLTALGEVGRAVSSTLDLETVLTTIVSRAVELSGLDGGVVFEYAAAAEEFVQRVATETGGPLAEARRTTRIRRGEGVLGQTAITLEPVQVPDITMPGAYAGRLRENLVESGIRAILAVPMVREGHLIGCLGVTRNSPGEFPAETIELMRTFATQSALAIQNARLFREIEQKSRELEAASRHKSEFLANMSHELRTPLNAIIGFSEVLSERMFGELNEKQEEYLKDIYASGQHLLSLINDILDLSKIEAGKMELELSDFDLPMAIDNALTLVRERAARRSIALQTTVDERLGRIQGDERKIRQVLLNLLSNAIKFTPEGGRIDVEAKPVDGSIQVSVSDTGVGIAPEDQEAVFEEFRQVGTADKKVEGTGLGLALSRKFIELHGGKIWVKSQIGQGSTFTFTIPVHRGE